METLAEPTSNPRPDEARRAFLLLDRPLVVDLVELTLNPGLFVVRAAQNMAEAEEILAGWQPHLAVVDMDHEASADLLRRLGASACAEGRTWPGITRRAICFCFPA